MSQFLQWFQFPPGAEAKPGDVHHTIRERILTAVLAVSAVLGAIAYLINVQTILAQGQWGWIVLYTIGFAWVLAITFVRKIPYRIRVYSLLVVLYALGIMSAMQYGAAGDARIWFMGSVLLAGVFLGLWEGLAALVVTTLTYLGIGWMMNQGLIALPEPGDLLHFDNFSSWTTTAAPYFSVGAVVILSIGILVNGLSTTARKNREYAETLAADQKELQQRSATLQRREVQIRTAAEISRAAVSELDPDVFFQRVVDLVRKRFDLYYVGVFTLDESGHYAVLRAGTGEAGRRMLAANHRLAIGSTSMVGYAVSNREARIASDVEMETIRYANPYLPETRSELAIPMISGDRALGAITVQSAQPRAFDQDDIVVFQGIADSLAIALENARLFQQLQESLQEIQEVHRQYIRQSWMEVTDRTHGISYTYDRATTEKISGIEQEIFQPSTMEVPLVLRDEPIGYLSLETARPTLTPQEMSFIESVAQQTALALENIRLVEETQRSAQQAYIISNLSDELSRAMDVERVLKIAVRELGRLPNISEATVHIDPSAVEEK